MTVRWYWRILAERAASSSRFPTNYSAKMTSRRGQAVNQPRFYSLVTLADRYLRWTNHLRDL